jgi:prefoldin beta subunit
MSEMKLTPEAQQILMEMQASQQQIQAVLMQKESLNLQNAEIDKALEEMKKTEEKEVFKVVGPVLIKAEKTKVEKEFEEKKELIDVRLKSLKKQEDRLKEKIKESQEKFEKQFKPADSESAA